MATRSRKPRKRTAKEPTKIQQAQKAAVEKRLETDTLRGQSSAERNRLRGGMPVTQLEPTDGTPFQHGKPVLEQYVKPPKPPTATVSGKSMSDAARKIAGLAAPVVKSMQANAPKNPIANPGLYGVSNAKRAANLTAIQEALKGQNQVTLKKNGKAVYMGPTIANAKIRSSGPERIDPDTGKSYTTEQVGDQTVNKDELLSWLSDESKVAQIKDAANKAGLAVQSYDDVAKLWGSVVDQAASSYSFGGKKVTPWALIQLRGKFVGPDGRFQDKISTSTTIDEMAPEQARSMFEQAAQQALGRAPTKSEIDDFIAKAQTIAHDNPGVSTTTSKVGFDGNVEIGNQSTITKGGADVVNAKSQIAAMDQAKQSEDYAAYQAAGNYFPMLFEALKAPV